MSPRGKLPPVQPTRIRSRRFRLHIYLYDRILTGEWPRFRQALRYIIRNTSLPQRVRATAQLKLSQMHCYTRRTQIQNRCIAGDIARGVFRKFKIGRVSISFLHLVAEPPPCWCRRGFLLSEVANRWTTVPIPRASIERRFTRCQEG